jgi:hypothetical protein
VQHQFTQGFSNAAGQFVQRVVVPTVNIATKTFTPTNTQTAVQSAQDEKSSSAKVFPFTGSMDLGAKAAS